MVEKNFLSSLEYMILLSMLNLQDNAYGVTIHKEICIETRKDIAYGAIYKSLKGLMKKGYVSCKPGEPTQERGGRAKTFYKINALGRKILNEHEESISRLKELRLRSAGVIV